MRFIILAPGRVVSGGPELAHQMCAQIKSFGYEAYMYYCFLNVNGPGNEECAEKFRKYGTEHIHTHEEADEYDNVVIIPEGLADYSFMFKRAKVILWWMSVDNYYRDNKRNNIVELDKLVFLHLVQSEYARVHLNDNGIMQDKIMEVSDYIDEQYGQFVLPAMYRKNMVLYNPKKGLDKILPLIDSTSNLEWRPLVNMSQEEMILLMEIAKVYVDFGNHPGKDRIPREAALCGCCIMTNVEGSAAFREDVNIPETYKCDIDNDGYENPIRLVNYICDNYEIVSRDFDEYRRNIKSEKEKFEMDVRSFLERVIAKGNDSEGNTIR